MMRTSAVSAQLSVEGAHRKTVAEPPALCADGYPDAQERDAEGKFVSAVHERTALQGMQAESTPQVVDVKVHRTGVQMTRGTFNTGEAILKEVDTRLPRCAKDEILNSLWSDGEIPSIDWVRLRWPSPIVGEVKDTHVRAGFAHILATSTRVKAGSAPVISANFARHRVVTWMLEGWNSLFQSKKYIGSNFLTLYQRKDTPFVPTHVKSGPWMHKVRHSHSMTACLVRCTTSHAPIGAYDSRFFPEESTACSCGFPMETMSHILYQYPSHKWELDPKEQLRYMWLLKFLEANKSAFVFDVP
jgi:hypothetical protein